MKLRVGDKVKIIVGKDKGKEGKIIKTIAKLNRVIVEGLNMVKVHTKSDGHGNPGGIIEREAPIDASNVKVIESIEKPKKETKNKSNKKAKAK
ncbi:MAG: 50S ribosomal protein L24 [Bacilli bacterium]|jgi:large subunit ribosomal protein L24